MHYLNKVTNSEINNSGFEVYCCSIKDSLNLIKAGYVKGNGTINNVSNYAFEDRNLNTGKYKFRLKQIDYNGNYQYYNLNGIAEVGTPVNFNLSQIIQIRLIR
jgi:hypothetical protein